MFEPPHHRIAPLYPGAALALGAAFLFGASTPFAKVLLSDIEPWMLAAVLYLGSGIGLLAIRVTTGAFRVQTAEKSVRGRDWLWLGGAILFGGVIGPVLLMTGLSATPAATASLLLNLEGVMTAVIAWFVFRENFDRQIVAGVLAIVAGATLLSWQTSPSLNGVLGPLAITGACLAWGIDNNLTRKVALNDPVQIALLKGLVAGSVNFILTAMHGVPLPPLGSLCQAALVGLLGYGASLVLFVVALRHLGAARTGAYYATAPFAGAVVSLVVLNEPVTWPLVLAGLLMGLGVWLHLTERHQHEHEHEAMIHAHPHRHDAHHQHIHGSDDPQGEPHGHRHTHSRLRHEHAHFPDTHHDHGH